MSARSSIPSQMAATALAAAMIAASAWATDVPGGPVSGTWGFPGSPYLVQGDITVPAGETLTIEPGVQVIFQGHYRLTGLGTVQAIGSETDSIHISGVATFDGIRLENENAGSRFEYCRIGGADTGLNTVGSPLEVISCRLHNHTTAINVFGVGDPTPPSVTIRDTRIEECLNHGIFVVENSNTLIEGCEITTCALSGSPRGAIQLSNQSVSGSNAPTIRNNWIHHNVWQGITAFDITGQGNIAPLISGNVIEYNLTGIYLLYASGRLEDNEIRHNFEAGNPNSGAGVMVAGGTARPVLTGNTLTGNFTALYVIDGAEPNLGDIGNGTIDDDGENHMFDNIDPGGNTWSVYNLSTANIKAENNRWDSDDPLVIAETIHDVHDNPAVGEVDFDPILPTIGLDEAAVPPSPNHLAARPNPFRNHTTLGPVGTVGRGTPTQVSVHDAAGRRVREFLVAGGTPITWDGRDQRGRDLPAGSYHVRARAGSDVMIARVILLR